MPRDNLKQEQNVFEARYEQGYRYLDRCGDVMIILENTLPKISNDKLWMPDDMVPTGARMKCPDLDIILVFDSFRLCVDHSPAVAKCDFEHISQYAFDTLASKLQFGEVVRFGNRQRYIIPLDTIEEAEKMSVKKTQTSKWSESVLEGELEHGSCEITNVLENKDRSKGVKISVGPVFKAEAPLHIDSRLNMPPHLLKEYQREALLGQLQRNKQRRTDPLAGLGIDIDYWWLNPKEANIGNFFESATKKIKQVLASF